MTRLGEYSSDDDVSVPFIQADIGPPTSGTHVAQEIYVDEAGELWVCTAGGTPGTWSNPAGGKELAYAAVTVGTQAVTSTTFVDVTGLSVTFDAPEGRPYMVEVFVPCLGATAGAPCVYSLAITDGSDTIIMRSVGAITTASTFTQGIAKARFAASTGSKTYKARTAVGSGDTVTFDSVAGFVPSPYFIRAWVL